MALKTFKNYGKNEIINWYDSNSVWNSVYKIKYLNLIVVVMWKNFSWKTHKLTLNWKVHFIKPSGVGQGVGQGGGSGAQKHNYKLISGTGVFDFTHCNI